MKRHVDQTFVVTGGALGIGAAASKHLAREGAHVIIADLNETAAGRVVSSIVDEGGRASFAYVDLSDSDSISAFGTQIANDHTAVNGLVNNAGIYRPASIEDTDDTVWEPQTFINIKAPVKMLQSLYDLLKKGKGRVVNVSSEAGYNARAGNIVYDASKAAISAITRSMACEFVKYGMRANAIAPGPVATELHTLRAADPDARLQELLSEDFAGNILRRWARPEEITPLISFLLSDESSFMTGIIVPIDGGMEAM